MASSLSRRALKVGTRTGRLARVQTDIVLAALHARAPGVRIEIVGIAASGGEGRAVGAWPSDRRAFVTELDAALKTKAVDVAVHSLKDVPAELPPGLCVTAVLPREDPRDALVSQGRLSLGYLPRGARVGTGSPRRAAQLLALRPDLRIAPLRGDVETRLRKVLEDGEVEATVLAASALKRLHREGTISEYFELEAMLPAVGQGFLGVECREDDEETRAVMSLIDDPLAHRAAVAERAFLAALDDDCRMLAGAHATSSRRVVSLEGMVVSSDGTHLLRDRVTCATSSEDAGRLLAERLAARGVGKAVRGVGLPVTARL